MYLGGAKICASKDINLYSLLLLSMNCLEYFGVRAIVLVLIVLLISGRLHRCILLTLRTLEVLEHLARCMIDTMYAATHTKIMMRNVDPFYFKRIQAYRCHAHS